MTYETQLTLLDELNEGNLTGDLIDALVGYFVHSVKTQHLPVCGGGEAVDGLAEPLGDDPALAAIK